MKMLFIIDPIEEFNIERDSSFVVMLEAQKRGYEVWYTETKFMYANKSNVFTKAIKVKLDRSKHHYENLATETKDLTAFDAIFMRKDPPFNMEYIYCTYLLSMVKDKTLVINDPDSIRSSNEKVFILNFPSIIVDTIVTKDKTVILEFLERNKKIVLKPLDRKGGEGIFILEENDKNLNSLIDISTDYGNMTIMCQKYIPEAKLGDKRIVLINGEPKGAFLRVPSEYDHRGNLCAGASSQKCEITARDLEICNTLAPKLKEMGLIFTGIDVLGDYVSEINVTSPTGLQDIANIYGVHIEKDIIDFVENNVKK
ncbi:MAG: glutathione synthase [Candidatus Sericytochromatia bacterium]